MDVHETLRHIQKNLKAPKNQFNKFGGYKYRNCEDILEAVKPLLGGCSLTISDEIKEVGNRVYVKATATLSDFQNQFSVSAWAREPESRKGMDESQITGAASSYARKYALNGLFCIDDTKDADSNGKPTEEPKQTTDKKPKTLHANAHAITTSRLASNVQFLNLCAGKGLTEDEVNDFKNWAMNAKKEPDFSKIVGSLVDNFEKAYAKWMEGRL